MFVWIMFVWIKRVYHYPFTTIIIMMVVVVVIQTIEISFSLQKNRRSLICMCRRGILGTDRQTTDSSLPSAYQEGHWFWHQRVELKCDCVWSRSKGGGGDEMMAHEALLRNGEIGSHNSTIPHHSSASVCEFRDHHFKWHSNAPPLSSHAYIKRDTETSEIW